MGLILKPSLHDGYSREQVTEYIEGVRARRMVAVLAYHNHQNSKITARADKIGVRATKALNALAKDIESSERLEQRMLERLEKLDELAAESESLAGQMVEMEE